MNIDPTKVNIIKLVESSDLDGAMKKTSTEERREALARKADLLKTVLVAKKDIKNLTAKKTMLEERIAKRILVTPNGIEFQPVIFNKDCRALLAKQTMEAETQIKLIQVNVKRLKGVLDEANAQK